MTKPTSVREIIEGIEDEAHTFDGGDCEHMIDMYSHQKVVAIALELERQRNSYIKCWMNDDEAKHEMNFHNSKFEKIAKGQE